MAAAETFIRTLDGGAVKSFTPRKMQANQKYLRDHPDLGRVFVHVESERGGSEWRPLELFKLKPPLDRIELYGANNERSKLDRSDSRVVSAVRGAGVDSGLVPADVSVRTPTSALRSPTETASVPSSPEESASAAAFPDDVRQALLRDGTDEPAIVSRRRDQRTIRQYLLAGAKQAACVVCGSELPVEFLIAAHLLPRSECTEHERLDISNLALMCSLGCDALFEEGVISIERGTVIGGPDTVLGETLAARVAALVGRRVTGILTEAETYLARKRALVSSFHGPV